jgi:hypothetical protein
MKSSLHNPSGRFTSGGKAPGSRLKVSVWCREIWTQWRTENSPARAKYRTWIPLIQSVAWATQACMPRLCPREPSLTKVLLVISELGQSSESLDGNVVGFSIRMLGLHASARQGKQKLWEATAFLLKLPALHAFRFPGVVCSWNYSIALNTSTIACPYCEFILEECTLKAFA